MSQPNDKEQYSIPMLNSFGRARGGFGGRQARGPVVKPKNFSETLRRLWFYFGKERKLLTIIFSFILVDSLLVLLGPYLIGIAIDAMSFKIANFRKLELMVIALTAVYIADGLLTIFQGWLMASVSQRIVTNLRGTLFKKLQKMPIAYFDSHPHGEVMSRLANDIDNVSSTISQSTTQLMSGSIAIIGSLIMMIVLSPYLTVVSLVTIPMVSLLARTIAKKTSELISSNAQEIQAELKKIV